MPSAAPTRVASVLAALWLARGLRPGGKMGTLHPFFFFLYNCRPFVGNLSLTTSAPCLPLSYSLPVVHSVTVCFTLDRPLSHSLSPTSIIYLSSIAVSFSFAAFLSLVNSSFLSAQPTLCSFTVSSSFSLTPPRLLLFISFPLSVPLSSPLIPTHSVFIRLCSLSQFG